MHFPAVLKSGLAALPLRARLAFWYGGVLAATLLLFAGFLQVTLTRALGDETDRALRDRAVEVNNTARLERVLPPQGRGRIVLPDPDVFAAGGTYVQIADLDGQVAGASANLGDQALPLSREALQFAREGRASFESVDVGREPLRVYTAPLMVSNRVVGVVQVARSLAPAQQAAQRLRTLLLVGGAVSVVGSLLVGGALAGAALKPIDRITQTALAIGRARDFSQRVAYQGPQDEVGRLAATFNTMLGELQQAYAELQSANSRLEAALSSQRRFVADASHELRTPLTTIRGNAGLLRNIPDMPPEDRTEALAQIVGESERMSRLVGDLLTLARADSGQHVARAPVALRPIVEAVYRQLRVVANGVQLDLGPVCDATVLGNADYLKQLVLILVDNAVKYTPAGGRVTVALAQAADIVRLEVRDTGVGIAPEDLPHIFERFYRADRARQSGGTGLGLAIARWIVDEHGGAIHAESTPGAGSTFTVELPVLLAPGRNGTA